MLSETKYQKSLVQKLEQMFPGCFILRNDPAETQGLPDLLILIGNQWAMLEVKVSASAPVQPNQPYYINMFNQMSFASFIYPEIEEQVLDDLQSTFRTSW